MQALLVFRDLVVMSDTSTKPQILTQKLVQRHESTDTDAEARHASRRVILTVAAVALTVAAVADADAEARHASRRAILTVAAVALAVAAVADADAEARHASRRGR